MIFGKKKSDTDVTSTKPTGRKDIVKVHEKTDAPVLSFNDLDVQFRTEFGRVHAVRGVDIDIHPGEVVALVGESGSGKSVTSMSALGLLPNNSNVEGEITVAGHAVRSMSARGWRRLRGGDIAMVFQEPMTALNPVLTIGMQITEALELHEIAYGSAAEARAVELLRMVGIDNPEERIHQYPHELSGGQRQRVVIAIAISCNPAVIVADEPTTALDVTVQADILDLLRSLKDKLNTGILLITHSMGVVADMADRVHVMFRGNIVESGTVSEVLNEAKHPYTQRLLKAVPHLGQGRAQFGLKELSGSTLDISKTVLDVKDLIVEYEVWGKEPFRAVDVVSFDVAEREIVGLVGESGSGKSTIGKCILGLQPAAGGEVKLFGENMIGRNKEEQKAVRKDIGVIFQDPAASLNPRFPVGDCIAEPLVVHKVGSKKEQRDRVYELLDAVQLPRSTYNRFPHELSGGQRQRVCIARALALNPSLLIADEPTSALDVSVQATVLRMLAELQDEFGFACLFISHDLAVVDLMANRVVVLQNGKVVEQGLCADVLHDPKEEYTKRLIAAAPVPEPGEQKRRREERHALLREFGEEISELKI
ncbi:ABC transporter ATP-binding protein [Flaviflexus equikiangi]|uniref:ABC transporter ATP-binding protein n=1 Tax=Flaviflexus equikiangi TaxID=2758573 RepID=A0ABS2TFX5_9ACTO|nr:ABC transporter ATP-binding protein [Flaviflexus equikiangi]MBM9432677.1 ABC transporter ATP-binding protein [Flaviflexus equikiangi]